MTGQADQKVISSYREMMQRRTLDQGGYIDREGGTYRPDATAWSILTFRAMDWKEDQLAPARKTLAADQLADGRVTISPSHPEVFWPTSLAILAWHQADGFEEAQARAIRFLLSATGLHWNNLPDPVIGHDASLRGWPWVAHTHSWVEPTALGVIALKVAGYNGHDRVREAERMLMNRQLPGGGWNYGNTRVFDKILRPLPESTGIALAALKDDVEEEKVNRSLEYLGLRSKSLRTPWSLGWAILGLSAWQRKPPGAQNQVAECFRRQGEEEYDTTSLSILLLSLLAPEGIGSIFR